jgi:hypothetical protein
MSVLIFPFGLAGTILEGHVVTSQLWISHPKLCMSSQKSFIDYQ